jgi:hypothetical protein
LISLARRIGRLRPPFSLAAFAVTAPLLIGSAASCARHAEPARSTERAGTIGALRYKLQSQVVPPRVTLGDRAVWRLRAEISSAASIGTLARAGTDSSLDVVVENLPRIETRAGTQLWSCAFRVSGYSLGRIALPRAFLPVRTGSGALPESLEFPPDTLDVDSLTASLRGSTEPDRGPVPTELRPVDFVVAAILAALLVGAIVAAIVILRKRRRARRSVAEAAARPIPPEVTFLETVEALRGEVERLPRDQFYDRLSLAVRAYAAAVTLVPALDRTTTELEHELRARAGTDPRAVEDLGNVLRRSNLAKFARREDRLTEARAVLDEAAALSGRLLARPSPAASPDVATGAGD